ncbi:RNA methyltransferase tRNA(m5U54)methyltransferase [Bonamia ostreae]|uniref:tRNA (guanine(26)-N(2))-dimethyltransferase n=1 Tax=Bonamia ostreae TaxID=126728 RepID=A0ABV2AJ62_9EUKA
MDQSQNDKKQKLVIEGKTKIKITENSFYNEAQVLNRDLSVAAIATFIKYIQKKDDIKFRRNFELNGDKINFKKKVVIVDGLSASGIRSIRYANELEPKKHIEIIANDIDPKSVRLIKENCDLNKTSERVQIRNSDLKFSFAQQSKFLLTNEDDLTIIDLDPYGSAAPFIQNSLNSIQDGGLLCVTCTDMRNFAGLNTGSCWSHYNAMTTRGKYCHELALRILLGHISRTASGLKKHIVPLASFSINFYVRVFVRVLKSPSAANSSCRQNGHVFVCSDCDSFKTQRLARINGNGDMKPVLVDPNASKCEVCAGRREMIGPIWCDRLHDELYLEELIGQTKKLDFLERQSEAVSLASLAKAEIEAPFYVNLSALSKKIRCGSISNRMFGRGIVNSGYRISRSHIKPEFLKTDAPFSVIWAVLIKHFENSPPKEENDLMRKIRSTTEALKIEVDFEKKGEELIQKGVFKFSWRGKSWGPKKKIRLN